MSHLPLTISRKQKAQVMLEFVFCMVVLFLMMFAIVMIFRWVGLDLGQRQQAHDALLESDIDPEYGVCVTTCGFTDVDGNCFNEVTNCTAVERGPLTQIDPFFYQPTPMNAVWTGN